MAAAMTEIRQLDGLGHELLTLWGAWNKEDGEGRASWSVKPRIDPVHDGHPPEKVNVVERILAPIKRDHRLTYSIVDHYYRRDKAPWQVALEVNRSEESVNSTLDRVAGYVEREYRDWQGEKFDGSGSA